MLLLGLKNRLSTPASEEDSDEGSGVGSGDASGGRRPPVLPQDGQDADGLPGSQLPAPAGSDADVIAALTPRGLSIYFLSR